MVVLRSKNEVESMKRATSSPSSCCAPTTRVSVGDHVVLSPAYCGHCRQCLSGHMAYCENLFGGRG